MKKRVFICLLAVVLAASMITIPASAEPLGLIGVLDYSVSSNVVGIAPSGIGTFTITVKNGQTDKYSAYNGVTYQLVLPPENSGIDKVTYEPRGTFAISPAVDSSGVYWFTNSNADLSAGGVQPNTFKGDMVCTVNIMYSGQQEAEITIVSVSQSFNLDDKPGNEYLESNKQTKIKLVPNSAAEFVDATLSSLSVSVGALKPNFTAGTTSYTVDVPTTASSITINAVANAASKGATLIGDGTKTLSATENRFAVTVTAPDGVTKRTYSINVIKSLTPDGPGGGTSSGGPAPGANTSGGTAEPVIEPEIEEPLSIDEGNLPEGFDNIRYIDVADPSAWYYKAVYYVTEKGLMRGTGGNRFSPEDAVTRAMFVTIIGRLAENMGETTTGYNNPFTADVPAGEWYTQYVAWGAAKGIVLGYSSTEFGPDDPVTREQMAALIVRFCNYLKIDLDDSIDISFSDADSISDWALSSVEQAAAAGLMQGSNGQFYPTSTATRAEIAQLFMNLYVTYLE